MRVRRDGSVEAARNGTQRMSEVEDFEDQWQPHSVFEYLQETFCFESACRGRDPLPRIRWLGAMGQGPLECEG